ncbi:FusB/FusC family EF-G-binding protein [Paenibacillus eucommiae]|uniref:Elongation factor G-binding protein n=1 Tax=Paenibacillus eucommiae TaxID=1355755 RepID=A0ABS4IXC2_9BACL|nr:FusB/FusC family EF-G-binding protein [Paenibacillus eucommiae]MBP1992242.1 hypothetical protein [Paenibacillus eucommiae]
MIETFIRNHQYNFIKKQTGILQLACKTVSDSKVVEAVRYSTESKVLELFQNAADTQKQLLVKASALKTDEDFQSYLSGLEPYLVEFPQVTEKQLKQLFPKNKKLKIPDLSKIDYSHITYLSWLDIATNKMFIVYNLQGKVVGIEGKYIPTNKKSTCFLCNKHGETALFSAVSKSRPANSSPDYYKAVGNYMCIASHECNKSITDITSLERFIQEVIG